MVVGSLEQNCLNHIQTCMWIRKA